MPKHPGPWYWTARRRWAATIDGKRYVAPPEVRTPQQAKRWYDAIRPRPVGALTVADLCEHYLEWDAARVQAGTRDPTSHRTTAAKLTRACAAEVRGKRLGELPASSIRPEDAEALVHAWRGQGTSNNYVRDLAAVLRAAFGWGVRRAASRPPLVESNPFSALELDPPTPAAARYATPEEADAWLAWLETQAALPVRARRHIPPSYVLLQRCLIGTGARPSEWTRATVGELDTRAWTLVRKSWKAARKTGRLRTVYVPTWLREPLLKHAEGLPGDSRIFLSPSGKPWTAGNLSVRTARYRRRAIRDGVPIADMGADRLTCYRWRHTAATRALQNGVPAPTVAEMLGTSVGVLMRTYAHILSSHLAEAAESLGR